MSKQIDTSLRGLAILRNYWKPGGSGPTSAMRLIYRLTTLLAEEKGYDLDSVDVVYDGKAPEGKRYSVVPKTGAKL